MWDRFVVLAGSEGAAQTMVTLVSMSMIITICFCTVAYRNNAPAYMNFSQAYVASTKVRRYCIANTGTTRWPDILILIVDPVV